MAKKSRKKERLKRIKKQEKQRIEQKKIQRTIEEQKHEELPRIDYEIGEILDYPLKTDIILLTIEKMIHEWYSSPNPTRASNKEYYGGATRLREMLKHAIDTYGRDEVAENLEENREQAIQFTRQAFYYNDLPRQEYSIEQMAYIIGGGKIAGEDLYEISKTAEYQENWEI